MYGQGQNPDLEPNEAASKATGQQIRGDVVVLRSGPDGCDDYDEAFTKNNLVKSVEFYESKSSSQVFQEREKKRFGIKTSFDLSGVPHISL